MHFCSCFLASPVWDPAESFSMPSVYILIHDDRTCYDHVLCRIAVYGVCVFGVYALMGRCDVTNWWRHSVDTIYQSSHVWATCHSGYDWYLGGASIPTLMRSTVPLLSWRCYTCDDSVYNATVARRRLLMLCCHGDGRPVHMQSVNAVIRASCQLMMMDCMEVLYGSLYRRLQQSSPVFMYSMHPQLLVRHY